LEGWKYLHGNVSRWGKPEGEAFLAPPSAKPPATSPANLPTHPPRHPPPRSFPADINLFSAMVGVGAQVRAPRGGALWGASGLRLGRSQAARASPRTPDQTRSANAQRKPRAPARKSQEFRAQLPLAVRDTSDRSPPTPTLTLANPNAHTQWLVIVLAVFPLSLMDMFYPHNPKLTMNPTPPLTPK
jgi:hypothetical protein